jgi:hypothetical protein
MDAVSLSSSVLVSEFLPLEDAVSFLEAQLASKNLSCEYPPDIRSFLYSLSSAYNKLGTDNILNGDMASALNKLKKSHCISNSVFMDSITRKKVLSAIRNNFACLYRRKGEPFVAIRYLREDIKNPPSSLGKCVASVTTRVNLSVLLLEIGKVRDSVCVASEASFLLKKVHHHSEESSNIIAAWISLAGIFSTANCDKQASEALIKADLIRKTLSS